MLRVSGLGVLVAACATALTLGAGTAGAQSPCDPIVQAGNKITQEQLAFTQQAYSDGVITDEEYAQSEAYTQAIAKNTADLAQCLQTGKLPPGYGPGAELEAICKKERDAIAEVARINQRRRGLLPLADYTERLVSRTGFIANGVAEVVKRSPAAEYANLIRLEAGILSEEHVLLQVTIGETRDDIRKTDLQLAEDNAHYKETCEGIAGATRAVRPALVAGPTAAVAARAPVAGLARRLKAEAIALRKVTAKLRSASPTTAGKIASKAAGLVAENGRLRASLARIGSLKTVRLDSGAVPKRLRKDRYARQLAGKPVTKVFANGSIAKAERRLTAILKGLTPRA
jgi:hypothetical protein